LKGGFFVLLGMQKAPLETLDNDQLLALLKERDQQISGLTQQNAYLQSQVEMYKRMQFGQKRERFEGDPAQITLLFEAIAEQAVAQEEVLQEKISYIRKRPNHKRRAALPSHLPVEEIEIYPTGDLSEMVCIGKEVTEELDYEPARFLIKRYIRYKYTAKNGEGVKIGQLPERVIDKGIPSAGLLASIVTGKYVDHLPLYRQKQRFAREDIQIASSTLEGWTKEALLKLEPLYEQLVFDIKSKGYWQVDESPIKYWKVTRKALVVKDTIGATTPLWMVWFSLITNPQEDPQERKRCWKALRAICRRTAMQFTKSMENGKMLSIWLAGRMREGTATADRFERALDNDKTRVQIALSMISDCTLWSGKPANRCWMLPKSKSCG
jgi:transposase